MSKPEILYAAFEAEPFMKTGGLGDVAGSLPVSLQKAGADVRLILPKFGTIPEEYRRRMTHLADFYMNLSWRHQYCGIDVLEHEGVTVYFIDNEYYFKRDYPYGYYDDGERIAFFSKAVLESLRYLPDFRPRIIHCNDWHTALIPVFLKALYRGEPMFDRIRTVFTVHNLKFQGIFTDAICEDILGLSREDAARYGMICDDTVNYMRGALSVSDRLTTVSPTYAEEICTHFYGERAEGIFLSRKSVLTGILNGIDTEKLDPRKDPALPAHFSEKSVWRRRLCKEQLQRELGLAEAPGTPLLVLVSRLTDQKGLDLLLFILSELMNEDVQFAVLGVGDDKYEAAFRDYAVQMPQKFAARLAFDEALSHRFYGGADLVLVPSKFEPCGLTQMMAMRYGALPLVRETGGLKDSVVPYNQYTGEGTGFSFANYNAHELLFTIKHALDLYRDNRPAWDRLVLNAMAQDFSWAASAEKYMALYRELL